MPSSMLRRPLAALPLALVALAVTACGSSKTSVTAGTTATTVSGTATTALSAVVGRNTMVALNPETTKLLEEHEITVSAVAPATYSKTMAWPVSSGQIAVATVRGTINHTGGFKLSRGEKSVTLTTFIIDTSTKKVTALVGGQRIPVFAINTGSEQRETESGGAIVVHGLSLTVTEEAATTLNNSLGVSAFKEGQVFGIAAMTLAVKT
jgi:hypothetical protein